MAPQELKYTIYIYITYTIGMQYKVDSNYGTSNICRECDHIDFNMIIITIIVYIQECATLNLYRQRQKNDR